MSMNLHPLRNFRYDFPSSVVVFLVALPLCLGIALASGAPLFSGIIAGIVGGMVIPLISKSSVSVSGPAAGLTTIVLAGITSLGSFDLFLTAVLLAGVIQVVLGFIRAGSIGNYFPSAVIKGMLAAIGLILILKQIPHAFGYDKDFVGDESFIQGDGENTFSVIISSIEKLQTGVIIITALSLGILLLWDRPWMKKYKLIQLIPAPLIVVIVSVLLNEFLAVTATNLAVTGEHLVVLPVSDSISMFLSEFSLPDFTAFTNQDVWIVAFTIAIVASLESLLSIDAADKLDPYKRITPLNRELKAQGLGNIISGLIGGLPVTSVIVRSSANATSGARTKTSAFLHGTWLLTAVILIPGFLNKIPLGALSAILILVGYKLVKPSLLVAMYKKGWDQFIPFAITIIAILFTNLLQGIFIGIVFGLIFVLKTNFHQALFSVEDNGNYLIRLTKDVSFLNKALLRRTFREIPSGSYVIIDGARSTFVDHDILETIQDFQESAASRDITVELNQSITASHPIFKTQTV